jgi:hypothetical protein
LGGFAVGETIHPKKGDRYDHERATTGMTNKGLERRVHQADDPPLRSSWRYRPDAIPLLGAPQCDCGWIRRLEQ